MYKQYDAGSSPVLQVSSNANVFIPPKYLYGQYASFETGNFTTSLGANELAIMGRASISGNLIVGGYIKCDSVKTASGADLDSVKSSVSTLSSTVSAHTSSISSVTS